MSVEQRAASSSFRPSQIAEQDVIRVSASTSVVFLSQHFSHTPKLCCHAVCSELLHGELVSLASLEQKPTLQSLARLTARAPQSPSRAEGISQCTATPRQKRSSIQSMANLRMFSGKDACPIEPQWHRILICGSLAYTNIPSRLPTTLK